MAPLYFFYNLPPSESKEILQDMLDTDGSKKGKNEKPNTTTITSEAKSSCAEAPHASDRCVVQ